MVQVNDLLARSELRVTAVAGTGGLTRTVTAPRIQKPGLALTGWPEQLHDGRVLVLGGTESDGGAINASGQVSGSSLTTADAAYHAFLWKPSTPNGTSGVMHDL